MNTPALLALAEFAEAARRCRELPYRLPEAQAAYQAMFDAVIDTHIPAILTAQPAEGVWRPIESAPRDGTPVLVVSCGVVGEARFIDDNGWYWAGSDPTDAHDGSCWNPSAWQPLPVPPAAARSEEQNGR